MALALLLIAALLAAGADANGIPLDGDPSRPRPRAGGNPCVADGGAALDQVQVCCVMLCVLCALGGGREEG